MCGAGGGNNKSSGGKSGGNNNKPAKTPVRARNNKQKQPVRAVAPSPNEQGQKPVTRVTVPVNRNKPAKAVKPFDTAGYNTRAAANKKTNIPILSTIIKDKYRNDEVSYNQAYWATQRASGVSQADMKAKQDSIGMKKAYSGDRVPTRFPNTGPPSQGFKEGTTSVNDAAPRKKIALTTEASEGGSSGGSNQSTASSSGTAGATGQASNLKNMLAINKGKKRLGKRKLTNKGVGVGGSGYSGLNIIS
jgi:hypothetical protein